MMLRVLNSCLLQKHKIHILSDVFIIKIYYFCLSNINHILICLPLPHWPLLYSNKYPSLSMDSRREHKILCST